MSPNPPANTSHIVDELSSTRTLLTTLPVVFIAEINGRAIGAATEVLLQTDTRFAGPGTSLSFLEVAFDLAPGAGGVQYLVSLIGRARALGSLLSGRAVDAMTAVLIGWVNKAFRTAEELKVEVDALAERIAKFPEQGIRASKKRVNAQRPSDDAL